MTQNEMNKEIRVKITQLFGSEFLEAVDSLDLYRSCLRDVILIKNYSKILDYKAAFDNFKDEINEFSFQYQLSIPIIIINTDNCLIEIEKLNIISNSKMDDDFNQLLVKNYKEIEFIILKKIEDETGKTPNDDLNVKEFIKNFWNKSCQLTLKNAKKQNFNYFQDNFLNKKYEAVLDTINNINFNR